MEQRLKINENGMLACGQEILVMKIGGAQRVEQRQVPAASLIEARHLLD